MGLQRPSSLLRHGPSPAPCHPHPVTPLPVTPTLLPLVSSPLSSSPLVPSPLSSSPLTPPGSAPTRPFLGSAPADEEFAIPLLQRDGSVIALGSTSAGKIDGVHSRSSLERAQDQPQLCPRSCVRREISYPAGASAASSRGKRCQRLPFWLVVINSSLSLQNDDENQFPNLFYFAVVSFYFFYFSKWNSCFPASPGLECMK